jgi:tetratricopeptide (TPR) repeat protein
MAVHLACLGLLVGALLSRGTVPRWRIGSGWRRDLPICVRRRMSRRAGDVAVFRKQPGKDVRLELARASRDFEAGQLARAAACVSNAVVLAPALADVHEMLARLAAHPRGGRDLFPLTEPLALGTVVARAHVVAAEGDFGDALRLLGKAQASAPGIAWADVPWVTDPVCPSSVNPAVVANLAVDLLELLRAASPDSLRPAMDPYLQLIRNAIAIHPDHANLLGAAGYFFRRFDVAEAAGYATRADELAPSRASAIALGYIYRDLGRADEALHAFERALGYDPCSLDVYADIGDLLMDAGRLDEGLTYARRALAIDPGHICSQVVVLAVQFCQTREAADLDALIEFCRTQPPGTHARGHAERVLQATVMKAASRTVTIQGSRRHVLAQARRFVRGWPD